tara:strand:- start:464 stop:733 length:270 start_codon:yes stop_codon:yes gene_type:complete
MLHGEKVQFTAEEEAARDAEEAENLKSINDILQSKQVREERDRLLAETDYLALSDVTMSDAWKTYRQNLRDIPAQSGFPNSVTYPTKPS